MANGIWFNLAALASLVPALLVPLRHGARRDGIFFAVLALAVIGPSAWSFAQLAGSWHTGLSITLWVSIAVSLAMFAVISMTMLQAWRLTPLLMPYLIALGAIATIWQQTQGHGLTVGAPLMWVRFHILVSVTTYGLLTIAAVAALACFLQERALKAKRPNALTRLLPPVADSEALSGRLLVGSEIILGLGLVSGMALQYLETGVILRFDHKTLLSLMAFALIGVLLAAHRLIGVRGRVGARLVLLAYLLLTLAYPGVKFVTEVLLHQAPRF
ncbi:MAG: cytochrome c biogenesis protein CcsA [Alphaproteobacteria bacterium]|nr:cytochrome c biogenesis protein CcsA [Alphaproteobacteria bacterium]